MQLALTCGTPASKSFSSIYVFGTSVSLWVEFWLKGTQVSCFAIRLLAEFGVPQHLRSTPLSPAISSLGGRFITLMSLMCIIVKLGDGCYFVRPYLREGNNCLPSPSLHFCSFLLSCFVFYWNKQAMRALRFAYLCSLKTIVSGMCSLCWPKQMFCCWYCTQ